MIFWDTSALVALLVSETGTPQRRAQVEEDPRVIVWWGTPVECESAFQRRLRERSVTEPQIRQARMRLRLLTDAWDEVPPSVEVRQLALRLLRTHPLRAADALQLAAALTLSAAGLRGLRFACADERLGTAAEIEGLEVI
ncbi:MAG: type II toxin-antitoxin system VapC family toxin [Verrucomicrobiales bacterium]|nr:type II toxin-antitoxin system VapC family toxin [Verrucomicrobiales bacterium]